MLVGLKGNGRRMGSRDVMAERPDYLNASNPLPSSSCVCPGNLICTDTYPPIARWSQRFILSEGTLEVTADQNRSRVRSMGR